MPKRDFLSVEIDSQPADKGAMKKTVLNVETIRKRSLPILLRHGVSHAALFGSSARGDAGRESDIDMLVEIPDDRGLLEMIDLRLDLESVLKRRVDLVEYSVIKPLCGTASWLSRWLSCEGHTGLPRRNSREYRLNRGIHRRSPVGSLLQ
jgi:predicted nucleotidyltransferase